MRLVLHTAAHWLMLTLRDAIPAASPLAKAEFATIRSKLIKPEQSDRESLEEDTRQMRSTLLCKSLGAGPITVCEKQKDIGGDDRRAADVNP